MNEKKTRNIEGVIFIQHTQYSKLAKNTAIDRIPGYVDKLERKLQKEEGYV